MVPAAGSVAQALCVTYFEIIAGLNMRLIVIAGLSVVLVGCATKSYPEIPTLSDFEKENMSCADLAEEMRKSSEYERQIIAESNPDINTYTGVLLDFGIRNAMALDDARQGLRERRKDLVRTYQEKGC